MALADYNYRYILPFKDVNGNQWRVRIFDRDEAGGVERLIGTGNPVNIYYESDEEFTKGIIGSECQIRVYGVPNDYGGSTLSQFFTPDEERFLVKVEWQDSITGDYNLYWTGFLHQDEYIENITYDPYEVDLVALDRLGTIKDSMDSLGYTSDSEPVLSDILQDFIDSTKLELNLEVESSFIVEGQSGDAFDLMRVSGQTFFTGSDEYVEMESISDVVSHMALSGFCRVWQQEGKLMFKRVLNNPLGNDYLWDYPSKILNIGNNLMARHKSSTKTTNISIAASSKNLLSNPSFEVDAIGDTTPSSWIKPVANNGASIEVSDETFADGSKQSLKTINNRISDSTFENASLADKLGVYTLLETSSQDVAIEDYYSGALQVVRKLTGRVSFEYFLNNTQNITPYELRLSLETIYEDGGSNVYYDFENSTWSTDFKWGFLDTESTGEWQDLSFDFLMLSSDFGLVRSDAPIVMRVHTMNYNNDGSLVDVEVYYDNFVLEIFTASGLAENAILPDTKFYNLSSVNSATNQTDSTDIELMMGISRPDFTDGLLAPESWELFYKKLKGMYFLPTENDYIKTAFNDQVLSANLVYRSMQSTLLRMRKFFDSQSKRIYSGTLATKEVRRTPEFSLPDASTPVVNNSDSGMPYDVANMRFTITPSFVDDSNASAVYSPSGVPSVAESYVLKINVGDMGDQGIVKTITVVMRSLGGGTTYATKIISTSDANSQVLVETTYTGGTTYEIQVIGGATGAIEESFELDSIELLSSTDAWRPVHFGDRFLVNLNSYTGAESVFSRFSIDLKDNRVDFDAIEMPTYTQSSPIPLPPSGG